MNRRRCWDYANDENGGLYAVFNQMSVSIPCLTFDNTENKTTSASK